MDSSHYIYSSAREKLIEHLFIGEVLKRLWLGEVYDVEVLRSEVDSSGYDLVMEHADIVRHIQLKSSVASGRASEQKVNSKLLKKPSGCVIWIVFDRGTLELGPFYWFGNPPRQALPDIEKFPTERPNIRRISKGQFKKVEDLDQLLLELFGMDLWSSRRASSRG